MKKSIILCIMLSVSLLIFAQVTGTFTDSRDGKIYKTVTIGTQTWMAENLAFKADTGCWAYNNDVTNVKKYGYLYIWETAITVCPTGWHLPSDEEWTTLTNYLGGDTIAGGELIAGGKLKEIGTAHWNSPNFGATNASGFTALPGGYRSPSIESNTIGGYFEYMGQRGFWWSSTDYGRCYARFMNHDGDDVVRFDFSKHYGFSIRCIRDL